MQHRQVALSRQPAACNTRGPHGQPPPCLPAAGGQPGRPTCLGGWYRAMETQRAVRPARAAPARAPRGQSLHAAIPPPPGHSTRRVATFPVRLSRSSPKAKGLSQPHEQAQGRSNTLSERWPTATAAAGEAPARKHHVPFTSPSPPVRELRERLRLQPPRASPLWAIGPGSAARTAWEASAWPGAVGSTEPWPPTSGVRLPRPAD